MPVISVRVRLVVAIVISVALGLLAVGVTVYIVERERKLTEIDLRLKDNLNSARFVVEDGVGGEPWPSSEAALDAVVQRLSPDDNTGSVGIWDGQAQRVPGVPLDVDLVNDAPGFVDHVVSVTDQAGAVIGATYAEEGVLWRYMAVPIEVPDSPPPESALFVMAFDVDAELAEINDAGGWYLIVSGVVLVAVGAISFIVAGRLLRPLRLMRQTAERVSAQSLKERLPIDGHDDVSQLARTMNDMLDRLDTSLESQKQLLSDVRHELRTPITIVRGHLELMDPEDPQDVRDTQELTMDELDRMNALVQNLSEAASLHGPSPLQRVAVDVGDLMEQVVRKTQAIAGADVSPGPCVALVAELDPARITQAVLQLAQNGVTHGGGQLVIGSNLSGSHLEIWVRDYGPGVPDDSKQAIFDRFQRGSSSGAPRDGGSGLGLNIVQMIARAHEGSARVIDATDGPGSVFIVSIPLDEATTTSSVSYAPVDDAPRSDPAPREPLTPTGAVDTIVVPPRPPLPGPGGQVPTAPIPLVPDPSRTTDRTEE